MAQPVRVRGLTEQEGRQLQHIVRRGSTSSVRFRRAMMLLGPGKPPRPTAGDLPPYPRNHLLPRLLLRRRRPAPGRNRERKGIDHAWAALRTIRAARPDGAPIYVILDNLSAHLNWRILVMDDGHRVRRLPGHGIDRPAPQKSRTPTPARPGGGQHRTPARPRPRRAHLRPHEELENPPRLPPERRRTPPRRPSRRHPAQPRHGRLNHRFKHHFDLPAPTLLQQPLGHVFKGW